MENLSLRLQTINQYAVDGLREFLEHPVQYSTRIIKDSWDAGVAVAAGLAWSAYGETLFGSNYREMIAAWGLLVSAIGVRRDDYSLHRNICVGFATWLIANDISQNASFFKEIVDKILDVAPVTGFALMELERRDQRYLPASIHDSKTSLEQTLT